MSFTAPDYGLLHHSSLLERLRVLQAAVEIARPLGFYANVGDWLWELVRYARYEPGIEARLHFVYLQAPIDYERRFKRNNEMEDSLEEFGWWLDKQLRSYRPQLRLPLLIAGLESALGEPAGGSRVLDDWRDVDTLPPWLSKSEREQLQRRATELDYLLALREERLSGWCDRDLVSGEADRRVANKFWRQLGDVETCTLGRASWSLMAVERPQFDAGEVAKDLLACLFLPDEAGRHPIVPEEFGAGVGVIA